MIEEIKEALELSTQAPWSRTLSHVYGKDKDIVAIVHGDRDDSNLIANAPTYIRYLLDELEKADNEISKYHKLHDEGYNYMRILEAEHADMKEVLQWIADASVDYQSINKAKAVLSKVDKP